MWHILKAEFENNKTFFIIWNLILIFAVIAFVTSQRGEVLGNIVKPLRVIGALTTVALAMRLTTRRMREKRDQRHCLLPISLQTIGITKFGLITGFWICLTFWFHLGIYLTQKITPSVLIKETTYMFAIAILFHAIHYIIYDQIVNISHPKTRMPPLLFLSFTMVQPILMLSFVELSFGIFGLLAPAKAFVIDSNLHIGLLIFSSIVISYFSSFLFAHRKSYLA